MTILHIGSHSAFVDFLVGYFERAAPGQNVLLRVPKPVGGGPLGTGRSAAGYAKHLADVVRQARTADVVVAHMLTLPSALAILSAPDRALCVWSGWGVDYYGTGSEDTGTLLEPETALVAEELGLDRGPRGGRPVRALTNALVDRAVRRVDEFSAPIPDDFEVMKARFPQFRGRYAQLNYADISSFTGQVAGDRGDVLLGNSAWPANNHLEALDHLSRMDLRGRRVLTPLTYGDPRYRDRVVDRGRELLGDSFDPLLEALPFEQYLDRISRCDVVVMNHNRQQGLGNVGIGLYSGAHLYLSPRNPLRAFLERSGLDVLDLGSAESLPVGPVGDDTLRRRRARMGEIWGEDVVLDNVRRLLDGAPSRG